jgi:GDP-L-fucose synthase
MSLPERIWVAGSNGMVGSAVVRALTARGLAPIATTRAEVDCTDPASVRAFLAKAKPQGIVLAAAKVGGIHANNTQRADFIWANLMVAATVIEAAHRAGISHVLNLGSSCIYPRLCPQPMKEEHLLTGALEPTNEPYAVAKIAGLKLIESFNQQYGHQWCSVMPTNLYGPFDNYDLNNSHVLPAMLRKFHEAAQDGHRPVTVWGNGTALREFLHVDDMAAACVFAMERQAQIAVLPGAFANVGSGSEITIRTLAETVQRVVGHRGEIVWDASKPNGTPRKLLDSSRLLGLGWQPRHSLESGLAHTYAAFQAGQTRGM